MPLRSPPSPDKFTSVDSVEFESARCNLESSLPRLWSNE